MDPVKKKILIIEDEKPLAHALQIKFTHEGFDVTNLYNGEHLMETLEKGPFVMIVCDLMMPSVNGFEVLQILKDNNVKIPTIILTNLSQAGDEQKARELGALDFIIKSNISIAGVVEKIRQQIA